MEHVVNVHIEKLPESVYLTIGDEVPGLVAPGRTITETLEIARDVEKTCRRTIRTQLWRQCTHWRSPVH